MSHKRLGYRCEYKIQARYLKWIEHIRYGPSEAHARRFIQLTPTSLMPTVTGR